MTVLAQGLQFPEGPVALPDGGVLVVEILRGTLSLVTPRGDVEVIASCGGGPNGAAFGPDGRIWICNNGGLTSALKGGHRVPTGFVDGHGSIQAVDIESPDVETVYSACNGRALCAPNDLVFDEWGGFWFTDPGRRRAWDRDLGGLYYATADGSTITRMSWGLDGPNGVGLSPCTCR